MRLSLSTSCIDINNHIHHAQQFLQQRADLYAAGRGEIPPLHRQGFGFRYLYMQSLMRYRQERMIGLGLINKTDTDVETENRPEGKRSRVLFPIQLEGWDVRM